MLGLLAATHRICKCCKHDEPIEYDALMEIKLPNSIYTQGQLLFTECLSLF